MLDLIHAIADMRADALAPWLPARRFFRRHERRWWTLLLSVLAGVIAAYCYISLSS